MAATGPPIPIAGFPIESSSDLGGVAVENTVQSIKSNDDIKRDRSSSLSDIEERKLSSGSTNDALLADDRIYHDDTEAETERLEESPQKVRKYKDIVLPSKDTDGDLHEEANIYESSNFDPKTDLNDQGSEISSLRDSSVESNVQRSFSSATSRKRKRLSIEDEDRTSRDSMRRAPTKSTSLPSSHDSGILELGTQPFSLESSGLEMQHREEVLQGDGFRHRDTLPTGRQRGKRAKENEMTQEEDSGAPDLSRQKPDNAAEQPDSTEDLETNDEDEEIEEANEDTTGDHAGRDEEGVTKKKMAMEDLGNIEKCFANLRDRLFDEKIMRFNDELTMLADSAIKHPELLGMSEMLRQRREDKIQYENKLLRYKLQSLQKRSIAEKAQIHTQYMQAVREIRDRNLEQANKEWYQIHRERRNRENDVPEYVYLYPVRKSQQIRHQTAYNKEVSLLSGIAKYRGFPAGPEMGGASANEIEEDLQNMGIVQQAPATIQRQASGLRGSLSASAGFQRQKPAAEERFLEQNPWANPQHPVHQQLQRQAPAPSRTISPLATPGSQKRPADTGTFTGSSSTKPEVQPALGSSLDLTLATREPHSKHTPMGHKSRLDDHEILNIPSRPVKKSSESNLPSGTTQEGSSTRSNGPRSMTAERSGQLTMPRGQSQNIQMKAYVPKTSQITEAALSSLASKAPSSPIHYSPVKAEDLSHLRNNTPTSLEYQRALAVGSAGNGHSDRFSPR